MGGFSTKPSLGMGYSIILSHAKRVHLSTGPHGTTVVMDMRTEAPETPKALVTLDQIPDLW